jgi:cytochrome c oxidase assembly protein subunit 11
MIHVTDDRRQTTEGIQVIMTDREQEKKCEKGCAEGESVRPPTSDLRPPVAVARRRSSDVWIASACAAFVALMVGAAYAAVPFYTWFCRTTGFGGIPQIVTAATGTVSDRRMTVRFDANIGPGLPWRFVPERTAIDVHLGEVVTVYFRATNLSANTTTAQAVYNVTPTTVGSYFDKINCFCFTEQSLAPGETRDMAVVFYVDPVLAKDSDQDDLNTITLSYTFYPVHPPKPGIADGTVPAEARGKS